MTGNLDAFCERCGKTATPSAPPPAPSGSKMLRRLGFGGRPARPTTPDVTALRLCLGCRGYICAECWNDEAAVCQTCQPLAGVGVPVRHDLPEEQALPGFEIVDESPPAPLPPLDLVWPASDLDPIRARGVEEEEEPLALPAEAVEDEAVESPLATVDSFDERWAEILDRVQAIGTQPAAVPPAPEYGPADPHFEQLFALAAGAEEPVDATPVAEFTDAPEEPAPAEVPATFEQPVADEPVAFEEPDLAGELLVAEELVAAEEPLAAEELVAAEDVVAAEELVAAEDVVAAEEPVAVDEPVVFDEPVVAEALVVVEEPMASVAEDEAAEADFEEPAADSAVDEPLAAVETNPEEDLWASVLGDTDAPEAESPEPDARELARLLQPRRLRRRGARPLARRPFRHLPPPSTQPTPPAPRVTFVGEPEAEPAPPEPPRVPKLPPALPTRPSVVTQPWPMPAPPAFLPLPPPPPGLIAIQPAPARFRPQVVPVEVPKPPATRPCGNCGLELSAKVTFCRRCGTRQPPTE